ncbi:unnamed protein product [Closterium sp. Naga37s-1]|nr:unnamed protein product [Closterium sp. Naga37s-1]
MGLYLFSRKVRRRARVLKRGATLSLTFPPPPPQPTTLTLFFALFRSRAIIPAFHGSGKSSALSVALTRSCTTLSWSFRGFYEKVRFLTVTELALPEYERHVGVVPLLERTSLNPSQPFSTPLNRPQALLEYEKHVGVDPMLEGTLAITPRTDGKHHQEVGGAVGWAQEWDPLLEGTLAITPRTDGKHHGGQQVGGHSSHHSAHRYHASRWAGGGCAAFYEPLPGEPCQSFPLPSTHPYSSPFSPVVSPLPLFSPAAHITSFQERATPGFGPKRAQRVLLSSHLSWKAAILLGASRSPHSPPHPIPPPPPSLPSRSPPSFLLTTHNIDSGAWHPSIWPKAAIFGGASTIVSILPFALPPTLPP